MARRNPAIRNPPAIAGGAAAAGAAAPVIPAAPAVPAAAAAPAVPAAAAAPARPPRPPAIIINMPPYPQPPAPVAPPAQQPQPPAAATNQTDVWKIAAIVIAALFMWVIAMMLVGKTDKPSAQSAPSTVSSETVEPAHVVQPAPKPRNYRIVGGQAATDAAAFSAFERVAESTGSAIIEVSEPRSSAEVEQKTKTDRERLEKRRELEDEVANLQEKLQDEEVGRKTCAKFVRDATEDWDKRQSGRELRAHEVQITWLKTRLARALEDLAALQ